VGLGRRGPKIVCSVSKLSGFTTALRASLSAVDKNVKKQKHLTISKLPFWNERIQLYWILITKNLPDDTML